MMPSKPSSVTPVARGTTLLFTPQTMLNPSRVPAAQPNSPVKQAIEPAAPALQILVYDDDPAVRNACAEIASSLGFATQVAESLSATRSILARDSIDVLLLDLKLPGSEGLSLLEDLRSSYPQTIVLIMTAFATVDSAVEAMRIGAGDVLTKPFGLEELSATLERAAQRSAMDVQARQLRERLRTSDGMGNLIGRSPAMEKLYRILSKVAFTNHPVLLLGESGTGKEFIAHSIHASGPNAHKPFIPVDCGSLIPSLLESELFGHAKGSFPGATQAKTGLLASAAGGTLFLDEIGDLPLDLQARLLRALQEREVRPIGSAPSAPLAARILAASNRDLAGMVESGRFRKDLYYRLNVVNMRIPALRERKEDIPLLTAHILERLQRQKNVKYTFSDEALRLLADYDWPGNVRELEHAIERACTLSSGPILHLGDFTTQMMYHHHHTQNVLRESQATSTEGGTSNFMSYPEVLSIAELEKHAILDTLRKLNGDKLLAARLLGIGKTTLYRKLKEYGLGEDTGLA